MKVSPQQLLPSQGFLKPNTVAFILDCIRNGELDQLPPTPIVRRGLGDDLIAIDGHNLIAVMLHQDEDIEVHLAESADDGLPPTSGANIQRNKDLKDKFESALAERERLQAEEVDTFQDLMNRYSDLFKDQGNALQ